MRLLDLFVSALFPVLQVLLITCLGSFLATKRVNILGPEASNHLNTIGFYVFSPSLVSSNIAKTITYKSMTLLWFMPVNILITFVAGTVFGWVIVKISRPPDHLRGLVLGCCAAGGFNYSFHVSKHWGVTVLIGNLGNIPIVIIPAMCKETGSPFGDIEACRMQGLAYASLSMAIGAIYMWLYIYNLIRVYSTRYSLKAELEIPPSLVEEQVQEQKPHHLPLQDCQNKTKGKVKQWLQTKLKNLNLRRVLAPSTIGAVIGFVIGMVPFLREMMIGDTAPLRVIQDSVTILGEASIATITLILGANLLRGLKGSDIHFWVVAGVVAVKYLALPLLGVFVVKGATWLGLVPPDPLYQFFLLLQFAVPPAMNIGTITQLFGVGEKECSVIMLWTNILATVALTFWSAFYMWLVS